MLREMRRQGGQALVQIAVLLLGLLLVLVLAVDAGRLYWVRRQMQNAADAGALAGARTLCMQGLAQQAAALTTATQYAQQNGAMTANVTFPQSNVVNVTAAVRVPTFFGRVANVEQADVKAVAEATCGKATVGCGLWPIAIAQSDWNLVKGTCGAPIVLIDTIKIDNGQRGWLDFGRPDPGPYGPIPSDCDNCGANATNCWIDTTYPLQIPMPACIRGEAGWKNTVCHTIRDGHIGDIVRIPVYDSYSTHGGCPSGDVFGPSCGGHSFMYHVVDFACLKIVSAKCSGNPKVVQAQVSCDTAACTEQCGKTAGEPPQPGDLTAVHLSR